MAERRADFATFRAALNAAIVAAWDAEDDIEVPTLPAPTTYTRPPLVFPNSGYSPGTGDPAFVELDWLPGTSTIYGNAATPIKQVPAILQWTAYVQTGESTGLLDILMDRVALVMHELSVATLHVFSTDDPVPAPAPPTGYYGQVIRTSCLRITQPVIA